MSTPTEAFQIPIEAAELYEAKFVPALFAEWAPHLADVAGVEDGQSVLDVACGTGIVSRTVADRVGDGGTVVGVDLNEAMLTVARRVRPDIDWRQGDVAHLPFADGSFDAALCQMALMFFPDRVAALREMARVVGPDGTVAIAVPASLDAQPAYGPLVDVVAGYVGPDAVSLLSTYFVCGDRDELTAGFGSAGLEVTEADTRTGTARFGSVDEFVSTEIGATPLADRLTDDVYERIRADAREVLRPHTTAEGALEAPLVCHLVAGSPTG